MKNKWLIFGLGLVAYSVWRTRSAVSGFSGPITDRRNARRINLINQIRALQVDINEAWGDPNFKGWGSLLNQLQKLDETGLEDLLKIKRGIFAHALRQNMSGFGVLQPFPKSFEINQLDNQIHALIQKLRQVDPYVDLDANNAMQIARQQLVQAAKGHNGNAAAIRAMRDLRQFKLQLMLKLGVAA